MTGYSYLCVSSDGTKILKLNGTYTSLNIDGNIVNASGAYSITLDAGIHDVCIVGPFNLMNSTIGFEIIDLQDNLVACNAMFYGCTNLTITPVIPLTCKDISSMFYMCTKLTIPPDIPEGVTNGNSAFRNCTTMQYAPVLPSTLVQASYMFGYCYGIITPPDLPQGLTIANAMFVYCKNMTTAPSIPSSAINLNQTFYACSKLVETPIIPEGCKDLGYVVSLTAITQAPIFPTTVTNLSYACQNCTSMTTIPQEVVNYFTNPPANLGYRIGCFRNDTNIVSPMTYTQIPAAWK